ncbi:MAG: hypothetical protein KAV99_03950 [Candidatus Latescibacteria bacterium]|nr:hypothetical protein [Candidatus Latescibacterota bacterium]
MDLKISRFGHWKEPTQVARIESLGITELYICTRPTRDEGGFAEQAHSMYNNLFQILSEHGASSQNVITEKVFFSDVDRQFRKLKQLRKHWYSRFLPTAHDLPATIFLHQPCCHPGRLCELQAYVLLPTGDDEVKIRTLDGTPELVSGKVVEYRGMRHLYLTNLTGGKGTDGLDFVSQAEDMFGRAETLLRKEGLSFRDVIRTWIYVNNIERDYADLNRVRTKFFQQHGVTRLPASTGIQGATYPKERGCAMDLYTLTANEPVEIEVIHAPTMNEARQYGSSFSRGMKVVREDLIVAYVSGTASIDNKGNVVHIGDIENQVHRMLSNVEELLAAQNITPNNIVSLITYLKEPNFLDTFYKIYEEHSFPKDAPNTVSTADICRPEWLCEIEAIAVVPPK